MAKYTLGDNKEAIHTRGQGNNTHSGTRKQYTLGDKETIQTRGQGNNTHSGTRKQYTLGDKETIRALSFLVLYPSYITSTVVNLQLDSCIIF